ncbi:MAG: cache and HAMP domain-containing protein, partial [Gammaproteobacteria bacterium]|nr:cache and HAMP domain-containing protein [Gammaproteobacteria bacterium]
MAYRVSIATVTVLGIGTLVGGTVALALYLGLSSATDNTRSLLAEQVDDFIDSVAQRISDRLEPVLAQASWIAERVESGVIELNDTQSLDPFIVGALSATPQVTGIAIVHPDGHSRRWGREGPEIIEEDWSNRPEIMDWLAVGAAATAPAWREPFWTYTLQAYVLLHDVALRRDGRFLGMFGQVVPISDLSATLVELTNGTGFVPFVLYDKEQVLAHPTLVDDIPATTADESLRRLDELDDEVLPRIWSPDSDSLFMQPDLARTTAVTVDVQGRDYVFLYRDIDLYGPRPWTIGVYFDLEANDSTVVDRLFFAAASGLVVLALSVLIAVLMGRRLSQPVQAIASVARTVSEGRLADARPLPTSLVREFDEANRSINGMVAGLQERETIRKTLGRYVPEQVAKNLLSAGGKLDVESAEATVLF